MVVSRGRFRRVASALALLAFVVGSQAEPAAGTRRDGAVHHEAAPAAIAHQSSGDHGHEDAATPTRHEHRQGHEHGTIADHCTHVHLLAFVDWTPVAPKLGGAVVDAAYLVPNPAPPLSVLSPPPRA